MFNTLKGAAQALRHGDMLIRLTPLAWGLSSFGRRQFFKGLLLTLEQAFWSLLTALTLPSILKLPTLGTVQAQRVYDPVTRRNVWNDYDNSFLILLFGAIGVLAILMMLWRSLRVTISAHREYHRHKEGLQAQDARGLIRDALGPRFHRTLLALPVTGVVLFTVIPLIVMILIGFTNYDRNHLVPTNLFTWTGLANFRALTDLGSSAAFAWAFRRVAVWTLVWAVLSTFSCYFGGILIAMLIAGKGTRWKPLWRTCFMVAMAVPQFVSLLLVRNLFADVGIVNTLLKGAGVTDWLYRIGAIPTANTIPFLTHPAWARPMILLINFWVGVPYQMLIATGILMNIPGELTEAARIDGAGPWQCFRHITMPYILFITGPSLVSGVVSNINNFNVIWLLSRDVYTTTDQLMAAAGATEIDLLVTWLYRLTQDQSNYKMASVVGMLVFAVCSLLTLTAFRRLTHGDREEGFH